ncbi:hypothetical protein RclHR1_09010004 [Rhizophagus clarus]|uniref:Uncharacterized protein n=1 Tax=Rhizophagus clarus TaxID=94130 RepID=A0A2Z6S571_9GLOM|nr:hypothetical protein RclHR1_09010004 [Rhizophagus clarus]
MQNLNYYFDYHYPIRHYVIPFRRGGFVARQFEKREITILPFVIELLKFYPRCIFTRSVSLFRVRKADLKAVFDFTYKQLILSSLPIIFKTKKMVYLNRPKVTFITSFNTLGIFFLYFLDIFLLAFLISMQMSYSTANECSNLWWKITWMQEVK